MNVDTPPPVDAHTGLTVVDDATCTACGCTCDDLTLRAADGSVVEARRACLLGREWFSTAARLAADGRRACTIDGRAATLDAGLDRAAEILRAAKFPLVYGLTEATSEAQRAAVGIADWLGATVDTPTSARQGPIGAAFQGVGEVTCTLGEVRNRGDLVIFWGANPLETHPRFLTKYGLTPAGQFVPRGRADRHAVVVDVRPTPTAAAADEFLSITPGRDFEALWTLRAVVQGIELDAAQVERETGVTLAAWQALATRMKAAHFGVFLFGAGLAATPGRHLNIEAMLALTRDLNAFTRFVALPLRGRGNLAGADDVLTWRTGYPFGVNHARGYPRFNPGEYAAEAVLSRGEADAALLVAADPEADLGAAALAHLASIPTVVVDFREVPAWSRAAVALRTSVYGLNTAGTVSRLDDVSLPLRPAIASQLPSDAEVLRRLERRLQATS